LVITQRDRALLTGTLSDGTFFDFVLFSGITGFDGFEDNATLRLTLVYAPGDANLDGIVNIFDLNLISSNWDTAGPQGDANSDGTVNIFDINLISAHWNQHGPAAPGGGGAAGGAVSAPAVPEPASIALLALAAPFLGRGAIRRNARRKSARHGR